LAAAGWKVYAGVRKREDGDRLRAAYSGDIEPVIIDVCDQASIDAADGRFVHIGSIAGRVASPGMGPYAASKHAVAALNWSMRAEFAGIGRMKSSVVEPGEIKTAIWGKAEVQLADTTNRLERDGLTQRYQGLMDMFRGFLAEANDKAIEPDKVAEAVEHALTSKRPKARYLVGTDAKIQAKLALLPDRAREFALGKGQDAFIKNGKKIRTDES
jgi:NAD(P)-dependent dehydrogenase (short-subunit alcohol dehydrogenase family)